MSITSDYPVRETSKGGFVHLLATLKNAICGAATRTTESASIIQGNTAQSADLHEKGEGRLREQIATTDFSATGWNKVDAALSFRRRILDGLPPTCRDI